MLPDVRSWPERMGVRPGGAIILVADITRIAWAYRKSRQRFEPKILLDAFLDRLGGSGTLAIPTFNYDLKSGERYDIRRTPTISGALGQAALDHPAFRRTGQPLHSFAVAGALRSRFLQANDTSSFGPGSAFALFQQHNFDLLAIDMPLEPAITYLHYVEETMGVTYRKWRNIPLKYTDADGVPTDRMFKLYAKKPGYVNEITALGPKLSAAGALVKGEIGNSPFLRVDLAKAHAVIENDILHNSARSIIKFRWKWWMRDLLRPVIQRGRPSRSALITPPDAARTDR